MTCYSVTCPGGYPIPGWAGKVSHPRLGGTPSLGGGVLHPWLGEGGYSIPGLEWVPHPCWAGGGVLHPGLEWVPHPWLGVSHPDLTGGTHDWYPYLEHRYHLSVTGVPPGRDLGTSHWGTSPGKDMKSILVDKLATAWVEKHSAAMLATAQSARNRFSISFLWSQSAKGRRQNPFINPV